MICFHYAKTESLDFNVLTFIIWQNLQNMRIWMYMRWSFMVVNIPYFWLSHLKIRAGVGRRQSATGDILQTYFWLGLSFKINFWRQRFTRTKISKFEIQTIKVGDVVQYIYLYLQLRDTHLRVRPPNNV